MLFKMQIICFLDVKVVRFFYGNHQMGNKIWTSAISTSQFLAKMRVSKGPFSLCDL